MNRRRTKLGRGRRLWGGFWRGREPQWDLTSYQAGTASAGTASRPRQAPGGSAARPPFTLHPPEAGSIQMLTYVFKQTLTP